MPELMPERLPFEIDERIDPSLVTANAGVPLVIELFRQVGAAQVVNGQVHIQQPQRGLTSVQLVETLVALWAAGGTAARISRRCARMPRWPPCWATRCPPPRRCATSWRRFMSRSFRCCALARRRPCRRSPHPWRAWEPRTDACSPPCSGSAAADRHAGCGCDDSGSPQAHGDGGL